MSMTIQGEFLSPGNEVTEFEVQVVPGAAPSTGKVEIACIGAWISTSPKYQGGIELSVEEFKFVLAMAGAGKLASVRFAFQEPYRGKSLIASASFSSNAPEEE